MTKQFIKKPIVTIAIPSFNQGQYLNAAIQSVFEQNVHVEVLVFDGGSSDNSLEIIKKWEHKLAGWRSFKDNGQSAAVNEGIGNGTAEFVMWLNSDDIILQGGLAKMLNALRENPSAPFVYADAQHIDCNGNKKSHYLTFDFNERLLANYCFICQPATLIRRQCWQSIGGIDERLHMAMDYDLWWRLYKAFGKPLYLKEEVAANRVHSNTKTQTRVDEHYDESMLVVKNHYGKVPLKWYLLRPIMKIVRYFETR